MIALKALITQWLSFSQIKGTLFYACSAETKLRDAVKLKAETEMMSEGK